MLAIQQTNAFSDRLTSIGIEARNDLLELMEERMITLLDIGDNWTSGSTSFAPDRESVENIKACVEYTLLNVFPEMLPELKLIFGPVPAGGIGVEFRYFEDLVTLTIWNNGTVELESMVDDWFSDIPLTDSHWSDLKIEVNRMYLNNHFKIPEYLNDVDPEHKADVETTWSLIAEALYAFNMPEGYSVSIETHEGERLDDGLLLKYELDGGKYADLYFSNESESVTVVYGDAYDNETQVGFTINSHEYVKGMRELCVFLRTEAESED